MSPAHAVFPPENAASAFMPFGDALYLDCAARTPMLRSVHAAGLAALEANATPWTQSSEALEAQVEAVRALAEIGRAHVQTPVTNEHLVCRLLVEKKRQVQDSRPTTNEH